MHELRGGELAALKAIPHTPYYGAVDTTPLYLLLICEVVMWTGDLEFFELLRDPIEAALRWIDDLGDLDGDGFVEYRRRSRAGLVNQGWRDAHDAVVHADGSIAEGPIALAEVQGYVYYAKRRLASLFGQLGDVELSERLQAEAHSAQAALQRALLDGRRGLRGDGPRRRQAPGQDDRSTAGHCLWSRIVAEEHVPAVARRLLSPDMFSGWGVRTMAKSAASYSPMSYYNGSVWPFDNALIVNGLKKHGFDATRPTGSPARCSTSRSPTTTRGCPNSSAASRARPSTSRWPTPWPARPTPRPPAAPFLMLQAILGLYANAGENVLYVHNPVLPEVARRGRASATSAWGARSSACGSAASGNQTTFSVRDKQGGVRVVVVE